MKISEVIEIVDRLTVNQYTTPDKVRWLRDIDLINYRDVVMTHENPGGISEPQYTESDTEQELIVKPPYAYDVYINYLQGRIAKENGEDAKYNKAMALYNEGFLRWANAYNEAYRPIPKRSYFRF